MLFRTRTPRAHDPRVRARARAAATALLIGILSGIALLAPSTASAALTLDTTNCSTPSSLSFGLVLDTMVTTTSTCKLRFGSSSGQASLRLRQADGTGDAMAGYPRGPLDTEFDGDASFPGHPGNGTITFKPDAAEGHYTMTTLRQPDGKIVVAAYDQSITDAYVTRLNADGSLDTSFGTGGTTLLAGHGAYSAAMALAPDGSIYVTGGTTQAGVAKLRPNGTLDTSFDGSPSDNTYPGNGIVRCDCMTGGGTERIYNIAVMNDGRIVYVADESSSINLAVFRRRADGSRDTSFYYLANQSTGIRTITPPAAGITAGLHVDDDGKITVARAMGTSGIYVTRLLDSGNVDTTFNAPTGSLTTLPAGAGGYTLAQSLLQSDASGRLMLIGSFDAGNDNTAQQALVMRITGAGTLDTTFSNNDDGYSLFAPGTSLPLGQVDTNNNWTVGTGLLQRNDGRLWATMVDWDGSDRLQRLMLLTPDGELDTSFSTDGMTTIDAASAGTEYPFRLMLGTDNSVILAGTSLQGASNGLTLSQWDAETINDYALASNDWSVGSSAFGFCMKSTSQALVNFSWFWAPSACTDLTPSDWRRVPRTGEDSRVADALSGDTASVELSFGMRGGTTLPGRYEAPIAIDLLDPNVYVVFNSVPPSISGTNQERRTLYGNLGAWNGSGTITYARQWLRCDGSGDNCVAISGATGNSYTLTNADVGSSIRFSVTATNSEGSATAQSGATLTINAALPNLVHVNGFEATGAYATTEANSVATSRNEGGGGTVTHSTIARNGNGALRVASAAGAANHATVNFSGTNDAVVRVFVRFDELPTADMGLLQFESGGNMCRIRYQNSSRRFLAVIGASSFTGPVIEARRWYQLDARCSVGSSPRQLNWRVNGVTYSSPSSVEAASSVNALRVGNAETLAAATTYYDDLAISRTSADYPIGRGKITPLLASGLDWVHTPANFDWTVNNGTNWTAFVVGDFWQSPGRAAYIDDWPVTTGAGADAYRLRSNTGHVEVGLADTSETVNPSAVRFIASGYEPSAGTNESAVRYADPSGSFSTAYGSLDVSTTLGYFAGTTRYQNGDGTGCAVPPCPWTPTDLNATSVMIDTDNVATSVRTDNFMAEVEFPSAPAPENDTAPVISGVARQGQTLETTTGTWLGSPSSYAYQWLRCNSTGGSCTAIGTNSPSYTTVVGDVGFTIRVEVRATNAGGTQGTTSSPTLLVTTNAPTLTYHSGYEHGITYTGNGTSHLTIGSGSVDVNTGSGTARTGNYYFLSSMTGGTVAYQQQTTAGGSHATVRFSFKVDQLPDTTARIFEVDDVAAGGGAVRLMMSTGGGLTMEMNSNDTNPWEVSIGGPGLQLRRWYTIEVGVNGATGIARWAIDGTEYTSGNCSCTLAPDNIRLGLWTSAAGLNARALYDDVALSETAGEFPLGLGRDTLLKPMGTGAVNTPASNQSTTDGGGSWNPWGAGDANQSLGKADNVDDISEIGWPGKLERMRRNSSTGDAAFRIADTTEAYDPNSIRLTASVRDYGAATQAYIGYQESGGAATALLNNVDLNNLNELRAFTANRRPVAAGGGTWTRAALNNLELRIDSGNNNIWSTDSLFIEVDTPVQAAPVNTTAPTVNAPYSTTKVGDTLSIDPGTWTGDTGFFSYKWLRCTSAGELCVPIASAASSTYTVQAADIGSTLRGEVMTNGFISARQVALTAATGLVANQYPTLTFATGFEANDWLSTAPTFYLPGGTPALSTPSTFVHSGNHALRANPTANHAILYKTLTPSNTLVARTHLYVNTITNGDAFLYAFNSAGPDGASLSIAAGGQISLTLFDNYISCDSKVGPIVAAGRWHTIDLRVSLNSTTWTADAMLNGVPLASASCAGRVATQVDQAGLGAGSGAGTNDYYLDDVAWSATPNDYPIGPGRTEILRAGGLGTPVGATDFRTHVPAAISPAAWMLVDELPMSSTDFVEQNTANASSYLEWVLSDPTTSANARAAQAILGVQSSGLNANQSIAKAVRIGDTDGSAPVIYNGPTNWSSMTYQSGIVPPTGSDWTPTQLKELMLRTGYASDVDSMPQWSGAAVEVEYRD